MAKSPHEVRATAQALGIHDVFQKDTKHLQQEIDLKLQAQYKPRVVLPDRNSYDARLMDKAPQRRCNPEELVDMLEPLIKAGLKLRFDEERWYIAYANRNDEGSLRMPPRVVVSCAERLLSGKR